MSTIKAYLDTFDGNGSMFLQSISIDSLTDFKFKISETLNLVDAKQNGDIEVVDDFFAVPVVLNGKPATIDFVLDGGRKALNNILLEQLK
jgi:hypothetical protein